MSLARFLNVYLSHEHMDTLTQLSIWASSQHNHLSAASLLILANLEVVVRRTAARGTSTYLDAFAILPGMHQQMEAAEMSKGEYPACAAMTTGYVFRVENAATVSYLQSVGRTGQVTVLRVSNQVDKEGSWMAALRALYDFRGSSVLATVLYSAAACFSLNCLVVTVIAGDFVAVAAICLMVAARMIFTFVIRQRAMPGWFGAPEPGVKSDLLVLLSQDRWVRIQGSTDDVKAVTSGAWLREATSLERSLAGFGKYLLFLAVVIFMNASAESKVLLFLSLSLSTLCAHTSNECLGTLMMHGRKLEIQGQRIKYKRRLDLAKELVVQFKRTDCFVGMGMIQPNQADHLKGSEPGTSRKSTSSYDGAVVM